MSAARSTPHGSRTTRSGCSRPASTASPRSARPAKVSRSRSPSVGRDSMPCSRPVSRRSACWPPPAAPRCRTRSSSRATRFRPDAPVRWCCRRSFSRTSPTKGFTRRTPRLIDGVGDDRLRLYLYHIPQVSGVGLSVAMVSRLAAAYPAIVAGVKDSSGSFDNSRALVAALPQSVDFRRSRAASAGAAQVGRRGNDLRRRQSLSAPDAPAVRQLTRSESRRRNCR